MRIANVALAIGVLVAGDAVACSICRCGDPTFNALGKEGAPQSGFRVALDVDRLQKSQGGEAPGESESMIEERVTLLGAWALSERASVFVRIPTSQREMTMASAIGVERITTSGLADPELYGQLRVWSSRFETDVGLRSGVFIVGGVKTPWGQNNLQRNGIRADEHLQPGTGSTDGFGGVAGFYQLDPKTALFASAQYRATGRNDAGYRYGAVRLANLAYEHKFTQRVDTALELNYRHAQRDAINSTNATDGNTGGSMWFVAPRMLLSIGGQWVLRAAAQVPLTQRGLNGVQHESAVFNLGVTYLYGQ